MDRHSLRKIHTALSAEVIHYSSYCLHSLFYQHTLSYRQTLFYSRSLQQIVDSSQPFFTAAAAYARQPDDTSSQNTTSTISLYYKSLFTTVTLQSLFTNHSLPQPLFTIATFCGSHSLLQSRLTTSILYHSHSLPVILFNTIYTSPSLSLAIVLHKNTTIVTTNITHFSSNAFEQHTSRKHRSTSSRRSSLKTNINPSTFFSTTTIFQVNRSLHIHSL